MKNLLQEILIKMEFLLCSINKSKKGVKLINKIAIYRDIISLNTEKNTKGIKEDIAISIEDKQIILKLSLKKDYNGIKKKAKR